MLNWKTCRKCGEPDVTATWRESMGMVACVTCHLDAKKQVEGEAAPVGFDMVRLSPAAQRAMGGF